MADGAMGYMFVVPMIAGAAILVGVLCNAWAGVVIRTFAHWRRKRKWIIAFAPVALFTGYGVHGYPTKAPSQWIDESFAEPPSYRGEDIENER